MILASALFLFSPPAIFPAPSRRPNSAMMKSVHASTCFASATSTLVVVTLQSGYVSMLWTGVSAQLSPDLYCERSHLLPPDLHALFVDVCDGNTCSTQLGQPHGRRPSDPASTACNGIDQPRATPEARRRHVGESKYKLLLVLSYLVCVYY